MTIQQEARDLLNVLPEDSVHLIVELIKKMVSASASESMHVDVRPKRELGIANGRYTIPENIDGCNAEIAEMFGVTG